MENKIKDFIMKWEEKCINGYYTGTEDLVVINTFSDACKMFGYDFEIFRNANNEIINIEVWKEKENL